VAPLTSFALPSLYRTPKVAFVVLNGICDASWHKFIGIAVRL